MHGLYLFSVTVHVLAAILWVGGMGVFALAVVPAARRTLKPPEALALLRAVGTRFSTIGWWLLGTLLVTGLMNLHARGVLSMLGTATFWSTPFGSTLGWKLATVTVMTTMSWVHGRDARREAGGERPAAPDPRARARSMMLGRLTFVLSVVVVVLAVMLVRG